MCPIAKWQSENKIMNIPGVPQKSLPVFSILGGNRWSKLGKFGNTNGQKTQFLIYFGQN